MTRFRLTTFLLLLSFLVVAQEDLLSKEEAIAKALENNFGILVANNNLRIAENNKSLMNSGFLPSFQENPGTS